MKSYFIFPVLLVLIAACDSIAQTESENRQVTSFSKLKVQNGVDVYLTQGASENLRIETTGYSTGDVITEVVDGELKIYRERSLWRGGSVKVYLEFKELTSIEASGGSDIIGENPIEAEELYLIASGGSDVELDIDAAYLDCNVSGGSDLDLKGVANTVRIHASGGSDASAGELKAKRAILNLSGGSDAEVYASEEIEVEASGGSDAVVHGHPKVRNLHNDRSSDVAWR